MILLDLNTADERPIYGQIADQVKFAVAGGCCGRGSWCPRSASCRSSWW